MDSVARACRESYGLTIRSSGLLLVALINKVNGAPFHSSRLIAHINRTCSVQIVSANGS
jgi:hypothetical protein